MHMTSSNEEARTLKKLGILYEVNAEELEGIFRASTSESISSNEVSSWTGFASDADIFILAHYMSAGTPLHTHDYYEFSYVLSAPLVNIVDGKRLYMLPDSLCCMNLNSQHSLESIDPDSVIVNIGIKKHLFEEGVFRKFILDDNVMAQFLRGSGGKEYLFFSDSSTHKLYNAVMGIARAYAQAGMCESFEVYARVLLLLDNLAKTPSYSFNGIDSRTMEMVEYIRKHCESMNVKKLAKAFGYSENYCTQYIRSHTGQTISEILSEARISRADQLLASTDLSVSAIAEQVGYKSYSHFNELFRSYHGMTPGDYRKLAASGLL